MQDSINKIRHRFIEIYCMCYGGDIAWNRTWIGGGDTTDNIFAGEFWNSIVFCG